MSSRKPGQIHLWISLLIAFSLGLLFLAGCGGQPVTPVQDTPSAPPSPPPASDPATLKSSINHIVIMVQENRSFDSYFGNLSAYWKANGLPNQALEGLSAGASNPMENGTGTISSFHLRTVCTENTPPGWNDSHLDFNLMDPTSDTATMDGFVVSTEIFSKNPGPGQPPIFDLPGYRTMGYYDGSDLNYYYFMASNFATSDQWFSPVMDRTQVNRLYLLAGTSAGHANPPTAPLANNTIFGLLQTAGISWKVYETDPGTAFLGNFQPFADQHLAQIQPLSQYYSDLSGGTLPAVAMIEPGYVSQLDEHPETNIQMGEAHVEEVISALMQSAYWKDTVFILTFDEAGGFYDHVPPQPAVSPDGILPMDLNPGDVCTVAQGPDCDFNHTGFRVPLIVISPFTKKNYVSHTVADSTAMLKLIETRFQLPSLTKRDAAQMDMTEFFDFKNPPWKTPPRPPAQNTSGLCDLKAVP
ncbi:MAG TPA: alkaline phosphatase family protein [Terriglobales bacterium]